MKNTFTLLLALSLSFTVCCQSKKENKSVTTNTPDAVVKTFQTLYPGENDPDWHIDANGNFEANFKKEGEKYRADFAPNGKWIETENSIKKKDLPDVIKKIIEERYSDFEISEVEHVSHAIKGIFYDVEFKQKGKNLDVEFKEDGTILN